MKYARSISRILAVLVLAVAVGIAGTIAVHASDAEENVIMEAYDAYLVEFSGGDVPADEAFEKHLANTLDIWQDTEYLSACEELAATVHSIIFLQSQGWEEASPVLGASFVLMDAVYGKARACRNEA